MSLEVKGNFINNILIDIKGALSRDFEPLTQLAPQTVDVFGGKEKFHEHHFNLTHKRDTVTRFWTLGSICPPNEDVSGCKGKFYKHHF
jgi:hypothetical protein